MFFVALIVAPLVLTSIVPVAVDRNVFAPGGGGSMTASQKDAAVRSLTSSATECIVRRVSSDPRLQTASAGGNFNQLIVESAPSCADVLRSMIDTYDELYGDGAGDAYFMGPFLDALPEAVTRRVKHLR